MLKNLKLLVAMAKTFEIFETIFSILCILVTFGLVSWCFYEYQLDLDLSLVSLKEFGEDENMIMPAISLCFREPFLFDKFNNGGLGFNVSFRQYKDFLLGKTWDDRMLDIDFENVTKKLEDYLVRYDVIWKNGSYFSYKNTSLLPPTIKKPYPSFVGIMFKAFMMKCYGINIPMNAGSFGLVMKKDIFPGGIRTDMLGLSFNYPNQFFRSLDNSKGEWPSHTKSRNHFLQRVLKLNTFEVTLRRNSRNKKCNMNWKEYDFDVARSHLEKIGCRTVYDNWDSSYPTCNSSEKMSMASSFITTKIMDPCQSADNILFDHVDALRPGSNWFPTDNFALAVDMQITKIKVIQQKRAYELQTLIGNSGGYIGVFLGTYYIHIHDLYTLKKSTTIFFIIVSMIQ